MTTRARALSKHRLAADAFAVDFADRLDEGEALTGTPTVTVTTRDADGGYTDVTSQFGVSGASIAGTTVAFALAAATTTQQDAGDYYVRVECDTDNSRHFVSTHLLIVDETADPDAP